MPWHICFFDMIAAGAKLPRLAFFNSDETLIEFTRRAAGPRTLEDKNILAMMMQKKSGEITLELTDEQYDKLRRA
jgi:hypothetical protein